MRRKYVALFAVLFLALSGLGPGTPSYPGSAATGAAGQLETSRDKRMIDERIDAVQNSLLPAVAIKGRPAEMKLADRMQYYKIPGVSIAVINEGHVEWARGFGVKEAGNSEPVTADTLFQAGSISKPVAAMAALRLVQDGKVDLDANVNDRLKTWKVPDNEFTRAKKVTLRELLSHTAGMTVHGFPGYPADVSLPTLVQVLNGAKPANTEVIRVDTIPGTLWRYSGGGYTVMQQLLIDVTGKSFPEVLHETVISKIQMWQSTYEQPLPEPWPSKAATAHVGGKPVKGKWNVYPEMAAAGLWTRPSDLASFAVELQKELAGTSEKVLSASTARLMVTPVMNGYALGLGIDGAGDAVRFGHSGVDYGFEAMMVAYEKTGQGAVVMTNGTNGQALCQEIVRGIAKTYHWPGYPMPKEKDAAAADPQRYKLLAGRYEHTSGFVINVTSEGDKIFATGPDQEKEELIPEPSGSFFTISEGVEITFERDATGKVIGFAAQQGGQKFALKKVDQTSARGPSR